MTPTYIKALLRHNGKKPAGRKVWSIDLETTWLPFFMATNVSGDTQLPSDALGCPLRLAIASDGAVKFGKSGRPTFKVAKELGEAVKMVRENFVTTLQTYSHNVATQNPDGYKAEVDKAMSAGQPIMVKDKETLDKAVAIMRERELAEAIRQAETPTPKAREAELAEVTS
jgi:hypothetical protein